jgi:ferredoxin
MALAAVATSGGTRMSGHGRVGRLGHRVGDRTLGPLMAFLGTRMHKRWVQRAARIWPVLPRRYAPAPTWPEPSRDTPPALRTVPGVWRDPDEEERCAAREPLHTLFAGRPGMPQFIMRRIWPELLPTFPRLVRSFARARALCAVEPVASPTRASREELTELVRAEGLRLGLSAIGFAPYDPKYTYKEVGELESGTVVVCLLEQDWERTQQIPSARTERHVLGVEYPELQRRTAALAEYIHGLGHRAQPQTFAGESIFIHYGVQAGLGQLGLNGQLLTPQAGSRVRLTLITTDLDLVHDEPVDYGIHPICDACRLCVRRCPPGAIPNRRAEHRGVTKAKIKTERCLPVLIQAQGCAICMKVCPVQRYGLDRVKARFLERGEILGKGTDELEGYDWIDGRHYGPGEKPRITPELVSPPGFDFSPLPSGPPEAVPTHLG